MKHTLIRTAEAAPAEQFSGCGHDRTPAARRALNAPPIFVNGVAIDEAAIALEAQNHDARSGAEARAAGARALVIRELLLQRARELGLAPAPVCDEQGREETEDEALIRQVLQLEAPVREPTEEECRRVYEAAPHRFSGADAYEASHILFAPADQTEAAWAEAEAQAMQALAALVAGGDFARLASVRSACPSASQGGALGRLRRGDLALELEDVLLSLDEGAVAQSPVRTRFGWHIVRLDWRGDARAAPYEAVKDFIRSALRERASIAASVRCLRALAARAEIEGLTLELGAA